MATAQAPTAPTTARPHLKDGNDALLPLLDKVGRGVGLERPHGGDRVSAQAGLLDHRSDARRAPRNLGKHEQPKQGVSKLYYQRESRAIQIFCFVA